MTKKNLIITIILLTIIDLVAAGWYMSRRIEAGGRSQDLFSLRDSTDVVVEADTLTSASQGDEFDDLQTSSNYFIANTPSIASDKNSCYTSIKHAKVRWPLSVNGNDELDELNKELTSKAFGNSHSRMKDARYLFLNTPTFNKPIGDDYHSLAKAPAIHPVYGNVTQVMVYPYMTSQRLLVMEVDKNEYNGSSTVESASFVHYDRFRQRVLSRIDILVADAGKETKLLKLINNKIDNINSGRSSNKLQHALNVPAEICCCDKGIMFHFRHGSISNEATRVLIDYDKLEPFFTEDFKQLQEINDDYSLFDEKIKPEPVNSTRQPQALYQQPAVKKADVNKTAVKKSSTGKGYQKQQFKPKRTKKRYYNGAKRRSGRYGYTGKRRSSRRQR
jgi:hypothetical protein